MSEQFKRWNIWPITRGAFSTDNKPGYSAGHAKFIGCSYGWIVGPTWGQKELELWRLFSIRLQADGDIEWAFGKLEIKWHRASWRYHERRAAVERRKAKHWLVRQHEAAS